MSHIYPIFDTILSQGEKEQLLRQRGKVFWMVGLSGSGKSTLARALENDLYQRGFATKLLDGDNMRTGVNANLGFSPEDRQENLRRAAEVAKLFAHAGLVTICSFISPTAESRRQARDIIGQADFREVFIDSPLEVCEARDVKGLYAKARAGEIPDFTGISAPFDAPTNPDIHIDSATHTLEESLAQLAEAVVPQIQYTETIN